MLFDRLDKSLAEKIESFPESGMLYWRLTVILKDGTRIPHVICGHNRWGYGFVTPDGKRIRKRQIADVEWEGFGPPPELVPPVLDRP